MRVHLVTPCFDSFPETERRLTELEASGITRHTIRGMPVLGDARDILANLALRQGAELLVHVDSDIVFTPQDWGALIDAAQSRSFVSGMYVRKDGQLTARFAEAGPLDKPREALFVGLGFAAVNAKVYRSMQGSCPTALNLGGVSWYDQMYLDSIKRGEDESFCRRAAEAGHPPIVLPDIRVGHAKMDIKRVPEGELLVSERGDLAVA